LEKWNPSQLQSNFVHFPVLARFRSLLVRIKSLCTPAVPPEFPLGLKSPQAYLKFHLALFKSFLARFQHLWMMLLYFLLSTASSPPL
ncbi:hypothetical protein BGZ65_009328, partial [Modicella reniformis]